MPSHVLLARFRRLAGRRRPRRFLVAAVVVLTCLVFAAQLRATDAARQRWTDTRVVAVARRDLAAGQVVEAAAVELREVPAAAVAPTALEEVPLDAVVRYPVEAGEALVASRLAPDGLTGIAALVPAGERAVALPVGPAARPPLRVGDRVDVLALVAPGHPRPHSHPPEPSGEGEHEGEDGGDPGEPGHTAEPAEGDDGEPRGVVPLVERALVVDVGDEAVTVAVPAILASSVAAAVTQGAVLLALTGG